MTMVLLIFFEAVMFVTAVILLGYFIYSLYNNIFTGVKNINTNLIINSLLEVTVVVILGVFIYTLYKFIYINLNAFDFTNLYCLVERINGDKAKILSLVIMELLQYIVGIPANGYDITSLSVFNEMIEIGELCIAPVNEVYVNCIEVNNRFYTVHPNIVGLYLDTLLKSYFFR